MSTGYRFCPRCAAPREGDLPYCGQCAYAFADATAQPVRHWPGEREERPRPDYTTKPARHWPGEEEEPRAPRSATKPARHWPGEEDVEEYRPRATVEAASRSRDTTLDRQGWWTRPKILASLAVVIALCCVSETQRGVRIDWALLVSVLNPVFWIAATVAGFFLWRMGERGTAAGVVVGSAVAVFAAFRVIFS